MPAVSEPLGRQRSRSAPTARSTSRGGDGASFNFVDYGQDGSPLNPCGDPPAASGATLTPPTARAAPCAARTCARRATRSRSTARCCASTPTPGPGCRTTRSRRSADANERRIIAYGLRNPFRFTIRPGTSEVWLGDVGWNDWEEINRIANPTDSVVENFGWPCYEGSARQSGYDGANLNICENLYGQAGAVTPPFFAYNHSAQVVPARAVRRAARRSPAWRSVLQRRALSGLL